ncbi:MAG: type II secretion system protein GspJ [Nitrospinota bacterium]
MWRGESPSLSGPAGAGREEFPRGFTLLELLVALSILAAIVAGLYLSIGTNASFARRLRSRLEGQQAARLALQRVAADLAGALWSPGRAHLYFEGARQEGPTGRTDRLSFTAAIYRWGEEGGKRDELAAVSYSLGPGPGGGSLLRQESPPLAGGAPAASEGPVVILEEVRELAFSYLDTEGGAHDNWSTRSPEERAQLPAAVRLTVRLGSGPDEGRTLSTLAAVPAGLHPPPPAGPGR